ncbi:hypothetical protein HUA78_08260 [Myxococcus sp. CA033]|uniref:DUF7151 family protein n=1 Tax=Myxococcus sp. CA033 TaxID=2741516 RepID=UPI00157B6CD1|nr:hypothetical protein [Myxococcus sp. CA033]NTX34427.1 hypothetical protein [Myxococcus sp. CA033]
MRWTWVVPLFLLGGCDAIRLGDFLEPHATLMRKEPEPAGEHCEHGGEAMLAGPDANDDGLLSDDEADSIQYSCDKAPPRVVQRTREEPAGPHCEHGGRRVESGIDTDLDGVLGDTEVTAEEYVCATTFPGVLVRTRREPRGEACPLGGQLTHAGNDTNQDGILSDDEITRAVYGCQEPDTVLTRVVGLGTREDSECGSSDVYAVESGPDLDQDGTLDDDELRASTRICRPPGSILTRQHAEAPGVNCIAGGVAVAYGGDEDGSLVLEELEVLGRQYACRSAATHDGTYELLDATDVAALQNISHIRGGLIISSQVATEVVLPGLEFVEGSVDIHDNPLLVRVALTGLRFVRDDVVIARNPQLNSLMFGPASFPPSREVQVGRSLRVEQNARLFSLAGTGALTPRQGLEITDNAILEGAGTFSFVESITGTVRIAGNPALRDVPLPQVALVGSLHIVDNPSLLSLAGLRKLRNIPGDASLVRNEALEDTALLENLQTVGREFVVSGNPQLKRLELPNFSRVGGFTIENNNNLSVLGPMRALRDVGPYFRVIGNPRLYQVTELGSLQSIRGELGITNNRSLMDLSGLERLTIVSNLYADGNTNLPTLVGLKGLREVDGLTVRNNPSLTELRLDSLAQVRVGFMVTGNTWLPSCWATLLAEAVHTGALEERVIESNDEAATCPP